MKAERDIKSISYVKAHISDVLLQVKETKKPLYITQNGEAKAVIMDTDSFESIRQTGDLLKLLSFGEKNITTGKFKKQSAFFKEIEDRFSK